MGKQAVFGALGPGSGWLPAWVPASVLAWGLASALAAAPRPAAAQPASPPASPSAPSAPAPALAGSELAGRWRIETEATQVVFELLHFGTSTIRGRFSGAQGGLTVDPQTGRAELDVRLPTASVSTGVPVFDARIRQADLLDSAGHPEAYFVARNLRLDGGLPLALRGEFTLRGLSQPLSLQLLSLHCEPAPPQRCSAALQAEFARSEFGLSFGLPFVGDRVRLRLTVLAARLAAPASP